MLHLTAACLAISNVMDVPALLLTQHGYFSDPRLAGL